VALSFALGWGMANAHVPQMLAEAIDVIVIDDMMFLRLLSLMLLAILAGMILDPLIPVLVPIILPTLLIYQVDLVHFGVLMVMAVVIGQVTPPMAIALVITSKLAGVDQMRVFRANMPFLWGMLLFTLLLMLVPEIATWLPSVARG
jgi:TRAP-type C4-dicarboxylate transport system permease large subunit